MRFISSSLTRSTYLYWKSSNRIRNKRKEMPTILYLALVFTQNWVTNIPLRFWSCIVIVCNKFAKIDIISEGKYSKRPAIFFYLFLSMNINIFFCSLIWTVKEYVRVACFRIKWLSLFVNQLTRIIIYERKEKKQISVQIWSMGLCFGGLEL